jgi:hypothetical protein
MKQQTEECTQDMGGLNCPPPPSTSDKPLTKHFSWLMSSVPTMLITRLDCLLQHSYKSYKILRDWLLIDRMGSKLVECLLLSIAAFWVRIQTAVKIILGARVQQLWPFFKRTFIEQPFMKRCFSLFFLFGLWLHSWGVSYIFLNSCYAGLILIIQSSFPFSQSKGI